MNICTIEHPKNSKDTMIVMQIAEMDLQLHPFNLIILKDTNRPNKRATNSESFDNLTHIPLCPATRMTNVKATVQSCQGVYIVLINIDARVLLSR